MKLRRIDILGFKSFRFKTGLEVSDGVTVVVGPNGCGKSNIVDAIRWCIGSQSAKDLRGRAMEDVIFAGSQNHKPMGYAEVSLTLENDGRGDVPAEWRAAAEIKVTRRLFRTGESEYEINGGTCRLRDIHELFLGTGVGAKEAYSIIEQGRIGFIVASRPEERRVIIEEAAGITRYKFQRRTAERRLERTRENLLRVKDVLDEVGRQLAALERQARRAARWKEMSTRRRRLEVCAALHRRERAVEAAVEYDRKLRERAARFEQADHERTVVETRYEQLGVDLEVRERALEEVTEAHYRAKARAELLQNNVGHHERERVALDERRARLEEQAGEQGRALERATAELADVRERAAATKTTRASAEADVAARREALTAARAAEREAVEASARVSRELTEQRGRLARASGRLESASAEADRLVARVREAHEQLTEVAKAERDAADAAREAADALAAARAAREAADATHRSARDEEQHALTELQDAQKALRDAEHQAVQRSATVDALRASQARGEGYGDGVRAALKAASAGALRGVERPLAERLRVDAEHERRLAGVLGDWLGALIVEDAAALEGAVAWAREQRKSLTLLLDADAVEQAPVEWVTFAAPVPGWVAARFVAYQAVDNAAAARAAGGAVDDGGVVSPAPGVVRIGAGDGAVSAVALARRLDDAVAAATGASERVAEAQGRVRVAEEALEAKLAARTAAREALDGAVAHDEQARRAAAVASDEAARTARRAAQARADVEASEQRASELESQRERFASEQADAEERIAGLRAQVDHLEADTERARTEAQRCQDALSEASSTLATAVERDRTLRDTERRLEQLLDDANTRTKQLADERVTVDARRREVDAALTDDRRTLGNALQLADQAERKLAEVRAAFDEASAKRREVEAELSAKRTEANNADRDVREMELKAARARTDLEHADSTLVERFSVSLEAAQELASGLTYDEAMRDEIAELTVKLERLGAVNPAAEEEFEEARERHAFLTGQRDDLETAMADLETAIRRMDKTSRELFGEMFEAVNERFQAIYPRLFRGGKAHLELTLPDDLLATGVEIVVQPPGKRLQSMTLLSGGEKALTAVALIFAIFQLKPTPFCILDEVDAPLDDANVARFAALVEEMSAESQFLIITHNKTTMEAARTLYGVTMQEPGVSNVVGVRLHGRELQAEA